MDTFFDVEKAFQKEQIDQQQHNIAGLLETSLDFWKFPQSIGTFQNRYPKICYYYGRLNSIDSYSDFHRKNKEAISLWVEVEIQDIGYRLFQIGCKFPNLSQSDFNYINELYSDNSYFFLIEDILFDKEKLSQQPKKCEISIIKSQIKNVPFHLKQEVFNCFLHNCDLRSSKSQRGFYFNLKTLEIWKKEPRDNFKENYYYIDFGMDILKFIEYVQFVLGKPFGNFYSKCVFRKDTTLKKIKSSRFNSEIWDIFLLRLNWCPTTYKLPLTPELHIIDAIVDTWFIQIDRGDFNQSVKAETKVNLDDDLFSLDDINTNVRV